MSAGKRKSSHAERRKRWLAFAPPATRALAAEADRLLVPLVVAQGFGEPALVAGDPTLEVSGRVIDLWREARPDRFHFVRFIFDKYRAPRFQIRFGEIERGDGRWTGFRSAGVVPPRKRHFHEWGKPRWCPMRFWSARDSRRVVEQLPPTIGQIMRFFEDGRRGPNLGEILDERALVLVMQSAERD